MKKETTKPKSLTAEELDEKFDAGENISQYLDYSKATRPGLELKRLNVDLPQHVIDSLDQAARLRGITRQALIKVLLFEAVGVDVIKVRSIEKLKNTLEQSRRT